MVNVMTCTGKCRKYAPDPECSVHSKLTVEEFDKLTEKLPTPTIVEMVIDDLVEREQFGTAYYGVPLLRDNTKKDALLEAYMESLDLCIYLRLEIARRRNPDQYELPVNGG